MKFGKQLKAILILFIICISALQNNCRRSKFTSNKLLKSKSKTVNKSKALGFIWDYLKNKMTDPENILYFVLGVLSEFSSFFETLYKTIQPWIKKFRPCVEAVIDTFKEVAAKIEEKTKEQEEIERNTELMALYTKTKDPALQKAYCVKVKQENENIFAQAEVKKLDRDYDVFSLIGLLFNTTVAKSFASSKEYCERVFILKNKDQNNISLSYGSLEIYMTQCMFFRDLDCDKFTTETGFGNFIGKAYKYYTIVSNIKTCITNAIEIDKDTASTFTKSIVFDSIKGGAGLVANIFTLGIWGGVKGGYYIVRLAVDLAKAWENLTDHLAFTLGQTFGKGIMIAKSILLGRRKKMRKHKSKK